MRPGRTRPGYSYNAGAGNIAKARFNEAGAHAPRILPDAQHVERACFRFNEAGAHAPRIPSIRGPMVDASSRLQ